MAGLMIRGGMIPMTSGGADRPPSAADKSRGRSGDGDGAERSRAASFDAAVDRAADSAADRTVDRTVGRSASADSAPDPDPDHEAGIDSLADTDVEVASPGTRDLSASKSAPDLAVGRGTELVGDATTVEQAETGTTETGAPEPPNSETRSARSRATGTEVAPNLAAPDDSVDDVDAAGLESADRTGERSATTGERPAAAAGPEGQVVATVHRTTALVEEGAPDTATALAEVDTSGNVAVPDRNTQTQTGDVEPGRANHRRPCHARPYDAG